MPSCLLIVSDMISIYPKPAYVRVSNLNRCVYIVIFTLKYVAVMHAYDQTMCGLAFIPIYMYNLLDDVMNYSTGFNIHEYQ